MRVPGLRIDKAGDEKTSKPYRDISAYGKEQIYGDDRCHKKGQHRR